MNILTRQRPGRHRVGRGRDQAHVGWEGEHTRELLALKSLAERDTETTSPIGRHDIADTSCCPMDGCHWPTGVYDPATQPHHEHYLLEHVRGHTAQDIIRTCARKERTIARLRVRP